MKMKNLVLSICVAGALFACKLPAFSQTSGNPVFKGWYADPKVLFTMIPIGYFQPGVIYTKSRRFSTVSHPKIW